MATKLKNLVITKVALVDEGSCSAAHIKLFKRKEGETPMNFEEILKSLSPEQQSIINAEVEKAKTMLPEGAMSAEDKKKLEEEKMKAEAAMKKMKAEADTAGQTEEELMKSVDPAVRMLLEKSREKAAAAEEVVRKMREDAIEKSAVSIAKNLPGITAAEGDLVSLYKSLYGLDSTICTQVFDVLAKANDAIANSDLLKTKGSAETTASTSDAAWNMIEKSATQIATDTGITKSAAITQVIKTKPELYEAYINAQISE